MSHLSDSVESKMLPVILLPGLRPMGLQLHFQITTKKVQAIAHNGANLANLCVILAVKKA